MGVGFSSLKAIFFMAAYALGRRVGSHGKRSRERAETALKL
jgi:hypothetical protein